MLTSMEKIKKFLRENEVTDGQVEKILDLMDEFDDMLYKDGKISHKAFEEKFYQIAPQKTGQYHFCEELVSVIIENDKWEATCRALYGNLPKNKS